MNNRYKLSGLASAVVWAGVAAFPPALFGQLPVPTAQMSGTVTDDAGNPLAGVIVTYTLAPDPTVPQSPSFYAATITDATGAFSSAFLPAGTYLLCGMAPPALSVLDNCDWTLFPPKVVVADSQVVTGVAITLARGANLQVRINDPGGVLANVLNLNKQGAPLLTQLWDDRGFIHVVRMRSFDAGGQNLSLVVPFGRQFQLSLSGQKLGVIGATGTALPLGTNIPFQSVATVPSIQYQFTVSVGP